MTAKEYAKRYDMALNFKIVAEKAFTSGLKQGRSENETERFKRLQKEVKKLRDDNKMYKGILYDNERLADWIAGS